MDGDKLTLKSDVGLIIENNLECIVTMSIQIMKYIIVGDNETSSKTIKSCSKSKKVFEKLYSFFETSIIDAIEHGISLSKIINYQNDDYFITLKLKCFDDFFRKIIANSLLHTVFRNPKIDGNRINNSTFFIHLNDANLSKNHSKMLLFYILINL